MPNTIWAANGFTSPRRRERRGCCCRQSSQVKTEMESHIEQDVNIHDDQFVEV